MGKWYRHHRVRQSFVQGGSFGLTSAIITTLGLIVGLHSGTHSRLAVVGGIVTIAIADAFADAFGMHVSQEAGDNDGMVDLWLAAVSVFITKFFLAITFLVPVLLLDLTVAVIVSVAWGFGLLGVISYWIAKSQETPPWKAVGEHFLIGGVVVATNHFVGMLVAALHP
jgi:VIT1/CCC1 family predicted Fe2+/Mn2+ transporter